MSSWPYWFEIAVICGITAVGTIVWGHWEEHTPKCGGSERSSCCAAVGPGFRHCGAILVLRAARRPGRDRAADPRLVASAERHQRLDRRAPREVLRPPRLEMAAGEAMNSVVITGDSRALDVRRRIKA